MTRSRTPFGFERESALWAAGFHPGELANNVLAKAAGSLPHLRSDPNQRKGGIFLTNGGRLYVDSHNTRFEFCTAENLDIFEAVASLRAFERLMAGAVRAASRELRTEIHVSRACVDPATGNTAGQHLNICTPRPPAAYYRSLLPYLLTEAVVLGAGGLVQGRDRAEFAVSPRRLLFDEVSCRRSERLRSLWCPRDEPLSNTGSHRLHLVAGEALASERGSLLLAMPVLIVCAAELGATVDVEPRAPLEVLHKVARDPGCRATFALDRGRGCWTAIQVQRHYVDLLSKHLAELPPWAEAVLNVLSETLDALGEDPLTLQRSLDWPMKYAIFLEMSRKGRSRTQMAEILDLRFGELGVGVFDVMDRAGLLRHRIVPEERIARAMTEPPEGTRAMLRGEWVRKLAGRPGALAWWEYVIDKDMGFLDLRNPLEVCGRWEAPEPLQEVAAGDLW